MTAQPAKLHSVLLVDSDPESLEFMEHEFTKRGFVVRKAEDQQQMFAQLRQEKADVIVMDLSLSRNERNSVLIELQDKKYGKPQIVLMVPYSVMSREQAYDMGAVAVISKPFDPEALISRIRTLLTPEEIRWRRTNQLRSVRHKIQVSLDKLPLGRGGFSISTQLNAALLEGETVEFDVNVVKEKTPYRLKGVGVIRYVSVDKEKQQHRGWGIEFSELEEDSIQAIKSRMNADEESLDHYIPKTAH